MDKIYLKAGSIILKLCGDDNLLSACRMIGSVLKSADIPFEELPGAESADAAVITDFGSGAEDIISCIEAERPAVIFDFMEDEELGDEIAQGCREKSASLRNADFLEIEVLQEMKSGIKFCYCDDAPLVIPYKDENELCNAAIALEAVEVLRELGLSVSPEAVKEGLKHCREV